MLIILVTKLMDLFRAVLRSQEKSQRVLDLTTDLLSINPVFFRILKHNVILFYLNVHIQANYTIWKYRRDCLKSINYDLNLEMDYMDKFAEDNPKNYQIWYHRRVIVELLGCSEREIPFCSKVFEVCFITYYLLLISVMRITSSLPSPFTKVDSKNYHAWAHRQWVVKTYQLYEGELEYTCKLIELGKFSDNNFCKNMLIIFYVIFIKIHTITRRGIIVGL